MSSEDQLNILCKKCIIKGPNIEISEIGYGYKVYYLVTPWLAKRLARHGEEVYKDDDEEYVWVTQSRGAACIVNYVQMPIEKIVQEEASKLIMSNEGGFETSYV